MVSEFIGKDKWVQYALEGTENILLLYVWKKLPHKETNMAIWGAIFYMFFMMHTSTYGNEIVAVLVFWH